MSVTSKVSSALATSGLLLLGFHVNYWDFRVLFSSLLKQPGAALSYLRARVATPRRSSSWRARAGRRRRWAASWPPPPR